MNASPHIEVILNGEPRAVAPETTVAALVEELQLRPERLAVEYNLEILPRRRWAETVLAAGDRLEVVHFVGGGAA
jgi:thiamine biosynthesis protein ThiS